MWSVLSVAETWLGDACIETGASAEGSEESGLIFVSFVRRRESACCAMVPNKKRVPEAKCNAQADNRVEVRSVTKKEGYADEREMGVSQWQREIRFWDRDSPVEE